jgi:hypothetical protein
MEASCGTVHRREARSDRRSSEVVSLPGARLGPIMSIAKPSSPSITSSPARPPSCFPPRPAHDGVEQMYKEADVLARPKRRKQG